MDFLRPIEAVVPGAQGRVLAVLTETTAELNMRTIARLSDVSLAQASRVLPHLVDIGLIERREVPPSSLFRLVREHVAACPLIDLARARDRTLQSLGRLTRDLPIVPASVIVFGSFARGEAHEQSDIDAVLVRPAGVNEDDEAWSDSVDQWQAGVARISGNPVEVLEIGIEEISDRLTKQQQLWRDIRRDGIVAHGKDLGELEKP